MPPNTTLSSQCPGSYAGRPRLKALKDRHLFLPRRTMIPADVQSICTASIDLNRVGSHWEQIVRLGRLLRTVFLCD
jgi:TnpA family transposase